MALTEGLVIGDVVKYEQDPTFCRETKVVLDGQTLVLGQIGKLDANGKVVSLGAAVDEVQTVNITGTLTAGTFVMTFVDSNGAAKTTDPIAYNANTAAIQTGVDSALGASKVTVGGTAITAFTLTFDGTGYAGEEQAMVVVDGSGLTGVEDITVTETTSGGPAGEGACLILLEAAAPSGADGAAICLVRNAVVDNANLTGSSATAIAELAKVNPDNGYGRIIVRTGPTYTTL